MSNFVLRLLQMSAVGGVMILLVAALRLVLKRAPKWAIMLLWAVVGIRLVCPVFISSSLGLLPGMQTAGERQAVISTQAPGAVTQAPANTAVSTQAPANTAVSTKAPDNTAVPAETEKTVFNTTPAAQTQNPVSPAVTGKTETPAKRPFSWQKAAFLVWLAGALAFAAVALIRYFKLKKRLATAVRLNDNVYQSEFVSSPFMLGIFSPRIYVPYGLTGKRLDCVLAHERAHIKRGDHIWKLVGFIILGIHWFDPLCWFGYLLFCRDIEAACDESVIKKLTKDERADYSEALLSFAERSKGLAVFTPAFVESGTASRIKRVISYKKPALWAAVICLALSLFLVGCSMLTGKKNEENTPDQQAASTPVPTEIMTAEPTPISTQTPNAALPIIKHPEELGYLMDYSISTVLFNKIVENDVSDTAKYSVRCGLAYLDGAAEFSYKGKTLEEYRYDPALIAFNAEFRNWMTEHYIREYPELLRRYNEGDAEAGEIILKNEYQRFYEDWCSRNSEETVQAYDEAYAAYLAARRAYMEEWVSHVPYTFPQDKLEEELARLRTLGYEFTKINLRNGSVELEGDLTVWQLWHFPADTCWSYSFDYISYQASEELDGLIFADPAFEQCVRRQLDLEGDEPIERAAAEKLDRLVLSSGEIMSLDDLDKFPNVTWITLETSADADLSGLAQCGKLNTLWINNGELNDISFVSGLGRLKLLRFGCGEGADLTPLAGLGRLETLYISAHGAADIAKLAELKLKELSIEGMTDLDTDVISRMGSLESLYLYNCGLTELDFVSGLTNLELLEIGGNYVEDIAPLAQLKKLAHFNADNNRISDLSPLYGLAGLEYADLSWNSVTNEDIEALKEAHKGRDFYAYSYPGSRDTLACWPMDLDGDGEDEYFYADLELMTEDFVSFAWLENKDHRRVSSKLNCGTGHVATGSFALVESPEYGTCIMSTAPEFYGQHYGYTLYKYQGGRLSPVYSETFYNYSDEGENSFDPAEAAAYEQRVNALYSCGRLLISTDNYGLINEEFGADGSFATISESGIACVICSYGSVGNGIALAAQGENGSLFHVFNKLVYSRVKVKPFTGE